MGQDAIDATHNTQQAVAEQTNMSKKKSKWWYSRIAIYTIFVLVGQTSATILGRLYFDKGGNSIWLATLVQTAGFPINLFFYYFIPSENPNTNNNNNNNTIINNKSLSKSKLALIYIIIGLLVAADCWLFSLGLLHLPVSTFILICASQLGFNALFSFFLNSQKFTPFVINSVFLLTVSSTLLVFQNESTGSKQVSKGKYAIGFICTVGASAGNAFILSLVQFCFNKVLKQENFKILLDMIVYPALVATLAILVGLFASGEAENLKKEMEGYKLGKVSYVMNLIWRAINWQVFSIGATGLIFEVSSLFSNAIMALGLPIVPVLAVFIFHDKMDGLKVISLVLAIWGFISYTYQHYLDDQNTKTAKEEISSQDSAIQERLIHEISTT